MCDITPLSSQSNGVPYNESQCVAHTCLYVAHTCLCVTPTSRRAPQRGGGGAALNTPSTSLMRSSGRSSSASVAGVQHEEAPSTPGSQQSSIALVISGFVPDAVCPHMCSHILTCGASLNVLERK